MVFSGVDGVVLWCSLGWTESFCYVLWGGRGRSVVFSGVDWIVLWCSLGWTGSFFGVLWGKTSRGHAGAADVKCKAFPAILQSYLLTF